MRWMKRAITSLPWQGTAVSGQNGYYRRSPMKINIDYFQALAIPAMDCGVRAISNAFAAMPLTVRDKEGEIIEDHTLSQIFNRSPSDTMTGFDMKSTMMLHMLMYGHAYAERIYSSQNVLMGLELRLPDKVSIQQQGNEITWKANLTSLNGRSTTPKTYTADQIFRVTALSYDTYQVMSTFDKFAEALGLSQEAARYALGFFLNSGRPSGVLESAASHMDPGQMDLMASGFAEMQSGSNYQRPAVLFNKTTYRPTQTSPNESQFIEARYQAVEEVARILDISPIRLHHLVQSSYNNIKQETLNFVNNTMYPWKMRFEAAINAQLFSEAEKKAGFTAVFDIDVLRVESKDDRYRAHNMAIQGGWKTENEVRDEEGMPPKEESTEVQNDDTDTE